MEAEQQTRTPAELTDNSLEAPKGAAVGTKGAEGLGDRARNKARRGMEQSKAER